PVSERWTAFQIQLAPSAKACTLARHVTPSRRSRGRQLLRNSFAVAIIANANTTVAAGKRCDFQPSGVVGTPALRLEITAIFKSFQPSSRVLTLPASVVNSTSPAASWNAFSLI